MSESYYGRPILKEPTWTWEVPCYLFAGGLAGASAPLAVAAEATGNDVLARRAWLACMTAVGVSPVLLIADLGRPERFLHMLRVFKPTSPMSMGSWILSVGAPTFGLGTAHAMFGWFPRAGRAAGVGSVLLGPALATYTAILVTDTAVPIWHEARSHLPWVFGSSATMSAGAVATLVTPASHAAPARRLSIGGALAGLVATRAMQRRLGGLGDPYRQGSAGGLLRAATGLIAGGAAAVAAGGARRRPWTLAGATALAAGAVCERWAVYKAGFASVRDPKYVVDFQRRRLEASADVP